MGSSENLGTNNASSTNGGILPLSLLESATLSAGLDDNSALTSLQISLRTPSGSDLINTELERLEKSKNGTENNNSNQDSTNYSPLNSNIFDSQTKNFINTLLLPTSSNNNSAKTKAKDSLTGNVTDNSLVGITQQNLLNTAGLLGIGDNSQQNSSVQTNSSATPTTSQISTPSFAIRTEGTISINGNGDFDGVPTSLSDDALIYAAKGFIMNGNLTLPVQIDAVGNPIRDANGKLVLVDKAVAVASGYTTSIANASSNKYAGLIPPPVVPQQTVIVPAYADIKQIELNRRIPVGTPTVTFNISQNPLNSSTDWSKKFPPPGTTNNPTVVRVTGGGLNIPANVSLNNYIITVEQGDINFNGNGHNFNNVVLIANNGNVNLSNLLSRDLSVFASGSINMNGGARFAGSSLLATGSANGNITFNGATSSINTTDNLKVFSQGDITYNGATNTRGLFLSVKNFIFNGNSSLYGSISAKGNIIFNGQATVIGVAELMPDINPPVISATLARDTAPFGQTNQDFITFDPTITGTVTDANPILEFRAGLNNTLSANYTNVMQGRNNDGSFSFSRSQLETINGGTLNDGVYTLHLQAKDLYGNLSNTFDLTFTLDTTTPDPNNLDLRAIDDSGSNNIDNITNKNTPRITGNAEIGAVVQLFNNGQTIGQATANNAGVWQIVTSPLTDGVYNLTAKANDVAGNVSNPSTALNVTIDSTLPLLTLNPPVDTAPLTPGARLTGRVDGTGSAITALSYHFNNLTEITVPFDATGAFDQSLNLTGLANGTHTLTITATDTAGNIKTTQYHVTVIIDQEAPVISASLLHDTAPNGQTNSDRITFDPTITGTVIDASQVVEFKAGFDNTLAASFTNVTAFRNADGSFTFDRATLETIYGGTLPDGFHTLHLQAVDEFHNTSNIFDFSFTFDTTTLEPIFNLNNVSDSGVVGDFQTKFDTVTLTGLAEANSTVVLEQTGTVTTSDNNGQFTFAHVSLATGDNSFTARSTDIAGNQNTFLSNIYRFSPPTAINLTGNTVAENSSTGIVIGQLSSVDPDPDETYTYILEDNADGRFRIVGNQLQVADGSLLNFESNTQHSITVTSNDANGLSLTQVFAIAVTNVNEAPSFTSTPIFTADSAKLYTYNIVAADPDAIESLRITTDNLPSWLTLVDNFDGTATLSGTPRDFLSNLNSNIHLLVTDANGLTAVQDFTIAPSIYEIEENNFTVFRSLPLLIPATPSILSFQINPQFDTTSINSINDVFEVALVDTNGNSLVHTVAGERDAFFNWTEGESTALGAGTSYDAATHTVSLNLTGINPGTNAQLVFRLVNNDGDITTNVRITNFALTTAPDGTQAPVQTDFPQQISQTTAPNFNLLTDVSSSIGTEYHRTSFNADTHLLYADIALRNIGSYSVDSPLIVAVNHISDPTVLVRNPDGFTPDGLPYYDFSKLVGDTNFDPNELTLQRSLIFYNSQGVQFTYDLTVLAQLNASPVILTQANKEVIGGHHYTYEVDATDPNGDSLTYKLLVAPDGMTIDQTTGLIAWNTNVSNTGNQAVLVEVNDGRGGITQQLYSLSVIDAPPNRPPVFTSTPVVDAAINTSYIYQAFAKDADDDLLSFSLLSAPQGMTVDVNTGIVHWTPSVSQLGTYDVKLAVADARGGTAQQVFQVQTRIELGNHAPIIISNPVTQVNVVNSSSIIDGVIFGLKSKDAPGSNLLSQPPAKLFSFDVNGSNFKDIGTVTLNGQMIDADGLALSEKYGLLGFALNANDSTLIFINPNTAVATALSTDIVGRQIRGAVFDLDDNLWVIDAASTALLNLNPLNGSILKSIALTQDGQPFSMYDDGTDIAIDGQGKFYLTSYSTNENGAVIYTLDQITGALTQVASDTGQYLEGITFTSVDNTNRLFSYEANYEDAIYLYKITANYNRTVLFPNIISEFNSGGGDLAAIVRKPRYSYSVQAIDPDNDSLTYSLLTAPTGMKIDSSTGGISWDNPVASTTPYDVTVQVQDSRGGVDTQKFILQVNTGIRPSEIRGTIWEDLDSDGVRDIEERGLSEVQVYLDLNKNGLFDNNEPTTDTNEQSEYKFTNLSAGNYIVREVLPNGFAYTSPQPTPLFSSNLLQNGSFEQGPNTNDFSIVGAGSSAIPYWNVTIGSVDYVIKSYWQSSDGNISIDLTGSPENGGLSQSFSTIPSKNYLVTFDLSTNPSINAGQGIPMIVKAAGQSATFIGVSSGNYQDMKYFTYTWQFSANSATTTIEFSSQSPFYARGPVLDKVSVVEIISQNDFKQVVNLAAGEIASDINFGNSRINQSIINNQPTFTNNNSSTTAIVGELWQYDAAATDLDKDVLTYELIAKPEGMIVDPTTGIVRWKPTLEQSTGNLVQLGGFDTNGGEKAGVYDIILAVRDGNNGIDLQTFQIQVVAPNTAPVFTNFPENQLETTLNYPIQYQFKAQDAEGDPITYSLDASAPNGATLNPITGVLSWKPTAVGNSTFNIIANDNKGGTSSQSINIIVSANTINANPSIHSQPPKKIALGQTYLYTVQASDPNYDPLSITLETAPQGMTIEQQGRITWQPGATQIGSNPVNIKVSDGRGGVITQAFNIDVVSSTIRTNNTPSITSTPNLVTNLERTYSYNLSGSDVDNDLLLWSLDSSPAGMVIDPQSGALRWQPRADQIGEHTVTVRLTDAYGLYTGQEFTLTVTGTNIPSAIVSNPVTKAAQNQLYTYTVIATDPENDPLTFSLGRKPAGMTIDDNGTIRWTPQASQIGSQQVEVFAGDAQGAVTTQTYTIEVGATAINAAPSITSTPVYLAAVGSPYQYQVQATDPDAGDRLTYQLLSVPTGVTGITIDATTGLLTWNNPVAGNYKIVVGAVDAAGLGAAQGFTLTTRENHAPVIQSNPKLTATPGSAYAYDIIASDVDGDRLTYSLDQASRDLGMTLDALGRLRWTPTANNVGTHHVVLTVSDGVVSRPQEYNLVVAADTEAPKVRLIANYDVVDPGETIIFQARATDNIRVAGLRLWINDTPVVLDGNGIARFTPSEAGTVIARAIATDTAGNPSQEVTFNVLVRDPDDVDAPAVSLDLGDNAGKLITAPIEIKGSISDDGEIDYYRLLVAPINGGEFKEIAFVNDPGAIANGVLGKFDPSLLQNDSYILRLEVADNGGHISYADEVIDVAGDLKLGNFRLSFTDLVVPVTGIPITLTRTYDSLNSGSTDDFGYGWRMEFRDTDLRTSLRPPSEEEQLLGYQSAFKDGTKVYITLPGGKREAFTFKPTLDPIFNLAASFAGTSEAAVYRPKFVGDKGVTSTLTVKDTRILHKAGSNEYVGLSGGLNYNPADVNFGSVYVLTTKEGIVYEIDAATGDLLTVTDTNGNKLTYTDAGIYSSTGKQVTFERDAQGRIAAVKDPMGELIRYGYNAQGDLVSVTDREGNTTKMEYNQQRSHYLDKIIDPLNRTGIRNEYGDDGRLKKIVDAKGNPIEMVYDPLNFVQTVKDALDNSTTYEYDARGNILTEIDALGGITRRTFDEDNNLLTETDPEGRIKTYTYDELNNKLTETDQLGNITYFSYNRFGDVLTRINPLGNITTYNYDKRGNQIRLTTATGSVIQQSVDFSGRISSITGANGSNTQFEYDNFGNVIRLVDALGNEITYTYDINGNQLTESKTVTATSGIQTQTNKWTYDANNRITSITDTLGNITRQEYDKLGKLIAVIDPLKHRTEYVYDDKGNLIKTLYADGTFESSVYDALGREIAITDQAGNTTHFIYDPLGRLVETINPDETPNDLTDNPRTKTEYDKTGWVKAQIDELNNRTEFEYDKTGRRSVLRDAMGHETKYTYDIAGNKLTETDALNRTTRFTYNELGRLIETKFADSTRTGTTFNAVGLRNSVTDQSGNTTYFKYDALNRPVEVILPDDTPDDLSDNPRTKTEYNELGQVIARIDELGNREEFEYDELGRLIESRSDCKCRRKTYTYDAVGNKITETDELGNTTQFVYDELNRLIETRFQDNSYATISYDDLGRAIAKTDQAGKTTQFDYDTRGRLTEVVDALQQRTEYSYDLTGNLIQTKDANNYVTKYEYDKLNRRSATVLQMGQRSTTTYDAVGNIASTTDFNDDTITYQYDALNRIITKQFPDTTAIEYTYTLTGQTKTVKDQRGVTAYQYDARDRLTERTDPDGQFIRYTYDAASNRTDIITSAGTTTFTYDRYKQLKTVTDANGGVTSYTYDKVGNLISTEMSNNTVEIREYDSLNRLVYLENKQADGEIISSYRYTLDMTGNRLAVEEQNGRKVNYTYDNLYKLTQEKITDSVAGNRTFDYTYDAIGNRLSLNDSMKGLTTYSYDENNRLLSESLNGQATTYTYDNNGNTLGITNSNSQTTYNWDYENHLIKADTTNATDTTETKYQYNSDGIRVASIVNGQETRYLIDANRPYAQVLEEYNPNGTAQTSYIYGLDLISQNRTGVVSFYHVDGLGSTRVLTNADGDVTDTYNYDAYGNLIVSTGSTVNNYLYTGEQYDPNIEDYYLRARYYDSSVGRFSTTDPFEGWMTEPLSLAKYPYVHGNPVNAIDPSGLFSSLMDFSAASSMQSSLFAQSTAQLIPVVARVGIARGAAIVLPIAVVGVLARLHILGQTFPDTVNRWGVPIIVWGGGDLPETTEHIFKALTGSGYTINNPDGSLFGSNPITPLLSRMPRQPSSWYNKEPQCKGKTGKAGGIPRRVCDEYPYATSVQGGEANYKLGNVSIHPVLETEQSIGIPGLRNTQGVRLDQFYGRAKVGNGGIADPTSWYVNFAFPWIKTFWVDRSGKKQTF